MRFAIFPQLDKVMAIPSTLRMATIALWICGFIAMAGSFAPGMTDASGSPVPYMDRWTSGIGFLCLGGGVAMMLIGSLIYSGRPWVRHGIMAVIAASCLTPFVDSDYRGIPLWYVVTIDMIVIGLAVRYFYLRSDVVNYFTRDRSGSRTSRGF